MTDERTPPTRLAGEFPFSTETRDVPAIRFEIDSGARVGVEFPGRAKTVREVHQSDRFGVVADGLDPDAALEIAAADPTAETVWNALGTALRALAEADCNSSEIMDYLAVRKCDIEAEEWAEMTNSANDRTIRQNAQRVGRKIAEGDEVRSSESEDQTDA